MPKSDCCGPATSVQNLCRCHRCRRCRCHRCCHCPAATCVCCCPCYIVVGIVGACLQSILRRPQWRSCEDIGAWYGVLNTLGFAAVITNCTMIAFVGSQLAEPGTPEEDGIQIRLQTQRLWAISVGLEHAIMCVLLPVHGQCRCYHLVHQHCYSQHQCCHRQCCL